jgi:DNA-binding winged helix-turn-helix (wHTH) protein/TolB-like protein
MTQDMELPPRFHRFEGFEVDTLRRELRDPSGAVAPLTSKAFDVLCALIAHRHEVAGKDRLISEVWPGRVVEENNLTQAVAALRRAFGTDAHDRRFIVTVPGRGYRFVAELQPEGDAAESAAMQSSRGRTWPWPGFVAAIGVAALAVILVVWSLGAPREPPRASKSVGVPAALVVLPFRTAAGASHDDLLELGLADALATNLGHRDGLRIRSLASVQRLGTVPGEPLAAARALGATYVLEGNIRPVGGDLLRVEARLLSVSRAQPLWSGTYETPRERVVSLQERIGTAVAATLALQPANEPARAPAACEGGDTEAFRALLRAQYHLQHRDLSTVQAFQEAIRRDPACARAYAGLATAYLFMAHNDSSPEEVFPLARAAALQALRINPDSAEAWMARGRQLQLGEWDWARSEQALRRAIALNPSLAEAHFALAHLLVTTGRFEQGLEEAGVARELDPLSPQVHALEGGFLGAAGKPQQAQVRLQRALSLQQDFWVALQLRGGMALDNGDTRAAVRDLEAAADSSRRTSQALAMLAHAYVADGQRDKAVALRGELQARAARGYVPPTSLAAIDAALGDAAAALDGLEQAERMHDIRLVFLGIDARWNGLRDQPRFQALARRLHLATGPATGRF